MKSFLEWYFRIPPAVPGEGTDWVWVWRRPWPTNWPAWWVVLVVAACAAVVIWSYRRDAASLSRTRRLCLTGLRLLIIVLVATLLTELSVSVHRTGLPGIALLVDTSASMSLQDQPGSEITGTRPKAGDPASLGKGVPHRLDQAIGLLTRENANWLRRLQASHQLRVWQFSETAVPLLGGATVNRDNESQFLQDLAALRPTGDQTRPAPAVRKVLSELRGMPPAALVMLTDGISSSGEADRLSQIAETARRKGVPLYLIGVGSEEPVRDLQLYDTLVDEVAFVGDPLLISAKLKSFGFSGQDVEIRLHREGSDEVLQKTTLRAGADGQPLKLEISYTPAAAGEEELVLEVVPVAGETND
ncbi:MAG TPA: vWA domain-containing protein, partial [Planctomycetaceae bacterium]|nr:vWA domain-containing protein [Planctomycetaceae bacterium]